MSWIDDMAAKARAKHGLPDEWVPWIFEAIPGALLLTGAVCPPITRGKNKGKPNYRKADPSTKITVAITDIKEPKADG